MSGNAGGFGTGFPADAPFVDDSGFVTPVWRNFLVALYKRTGAEGGANPANAASQAALGAEVVARQAGDVALSNGIEAETAARIAADEQEAATRAAMDDFLLSTSNAAAGLATETAARIAADDAEQAARIAGDNTEQAARIAGDNALQASKLAKTGDAMTGGTIDNVPIGGTTPAAGSFTALRATGVVSGAGFVAWHASPGPIGSTAPSSGAFTTLAASGVVSGAGFTNWAASPPAIGGTTPAAGAFTTLSASGAAAVADLNVASTGLLAGAWTATFGAVTAGTGTLTTVSGVIRYKKLGRMVFVSVQVAITANGTGAGSISVVMPFANAASDFSVLTGREVAINGRALTGTMNPSSTSMTILAYDNSYPGGTGAQLNLSGVYESST